MVKKIIVFSGKQFSGKDTVAKILMDVMPEFKRIAMGDAIKAEYSKRTGLSREEIEKNKPLYRADLIKLGDWGRSISPKFWIEKLIEASDNIIVTDVRVPFELEFFKSRGAFCIRVESSKVNRAKRGQIVNENDLTECALDNIKNWDYIIDNNSDYESLVSKTNDLISVIKEKKWSI